MTIFSTNLGGGMAPLVLPWLRLCFGLPLGNFLRTPLVVPATKVEVQSHLFSCATVVSNIRKLHKPLVRYIYC